MSGQSGSAVWQSAFQGAAMGAATAGVMWGITQGNSEIAMYREAVKSYRQVKAAAKNLNVANYPMYAAMLEYSAGAHINQAGISFTINEKETTIQGEIVLLDLGDFGAQAGVTDLSGTGGENAGIQISMGIFGKYCGPYITLKKNFDYTYNVFNPLRYIDGFGIGMGVGLSSPGTVTINPD